MTAKIVIASAERLIEVRHFWRNSSRMAEISVPAWPMPIQKTKLVMSNAQPTLVVEAPGADARGDLVAGGHCAEPEGGERHGEAGRASSGSGAGPSGRQTSSVICRRLGRPSTQGRRSGVGCHDVLLWRIF